KYFDNEFSIISLLYYCFLYTFCGDLSVSDPIDQKIRALSRARGFGYSIDSERLMGDPIDLYLLISYFTLILIPSARR
ncbi:hypothetical protein, partial [Arsukibacterium sp. MJ3]|uniref:hypothetical protein n=1 Tax=Arsukibacterium sp. MJ3 TaxID=1632859 RepID=UPI001F3273C9